MTLPWRGTTPEISSEADSRYETPGGAQNKVNVSQEYLLHLLKLAVTGLSDGSEAAIARYSEPYGITYDWLKDRLDAADQRSLNYQEVNVRSNGAKGDSITDDAPFINAAIVLSQSLGALGIFSKVIIPPGDYKINSPLIVPHGTEATRVIIDGYGAKLIAGTVGMDMIKVVAKGDPSTYQNLGETKIFGLRLECAGKAARGIVLGRDGVSYPYGIDGLFKSVVRDVDIRDFTVAGVEISDSRLWEFESCTFISSITESNCIYLNSTHDKTTSDIWFNNMNLAIYGDNVNNICVKGRVASVIGNSGLGGIHFTDCVFYGQAIDMRSTNENAGFRDIFITSCAVDGLSTSPGANGFYFSGETLGSGEVFIINSWINANAFGVYFKGLDGCSIDGGKISSTSYQGITMADCTDCSVIGVKLHDVNNIDNGGGAINLALGGKRNKIIGCNVYNAAGHDDVIILVGEDQLKPIVTNNTTDSGLCVTNNIAGVEGTDFIVTGNLNG